MYTRSFPSRRPNESRPLPPDYGGTALVIGSPHTDENHTRMALTQKRGTPQNPRKPLYEDEEVEVRDPIFPPPFGIRGQDEARQTAADETEESEDNVAVVAEKNEESTIPSIFDSLKFKSDDLLLLGLALLFFTDKELSSENIPTDALLILAMLYLSGM